jgi:hypothetical protein
LAKSHDVTKERREMMGAAERCSRKCDESDFHSGGSLLGVVDNPVE